MVALRAMPFFGKLYLTRARLFCPMMSINASIKHLRFANYLPRRLSGEMKRSISDTESVKCGNGEDREVMNEMSSDSGHFRPVHVNFFFLDLCRVKDTTCHRLPHTTMNERNISRPIICAQRKDTFMFTFERERTR